MLVFIQLTDGETELSHSINVQHVYKGRQAGGHKTLHRLRKESSLAGPN